MAPKKLKAPPKASGRGNSSHSLPCSSSSSCLLFSLLLLFMYSCSLNLLVIKCHLHGGFCSHKLVRLPKASVIFLTCGTRCFDMYFEGLLELSPEHRRVCFLVFVFSFYCNCWGASCGCCCPCVQLTTLRRECEGDCATIVGWGPFSVVLVAFPYQIVVSV